MRRSFEAEGGRSRWPGRRIPAVTWQAEGRAVDLLREAEEAAARRLGEARLEEGRLRAEAAARGFAEGLAQAAAARLEAEARCDEALRGAAAEAIDLAVEMARRLLGRELAADPAAARASAEAALAAARGQRRAALRLHPAAAAALAEEAGRLATLAGVPWVQLVADPDLGPGDAIVETPVGRVDGRLEVRLADLRRALEDGR